MEQLVKDVYAIRKDMREQKRKSKFPLLMLSPFFFLVTIFIIVPVILMLVMSFTDMGLSLKWNFIGTENFEKIFGHPDIPKIIGRTLFFVAISTFFSVIGSIFVVVITTYYLDIVYCRENLGLLFRIIWLLPSLTPSVVYMFIWRFVLGPQEYGMLNKILLWLNMPSVAWFTDSAFPIVIFVCCLASASGSIILFSSAIRQIPNNIIQSAKVDGASSLYICRKIVLPYLAWPIMQKTLWSVLGFFTTYEMIRLLTMGGPMGKTTTYAYYIYQNAYIYRTYGLGAALSVFMVAMSIVFGFVILRLFRVDKQMRAPRMDI